ncbi:phage antirepressor KilAC domain-containing protein [Weissella minor]|uniref:phage antirepressor KilAC domain-containing protein n=1 Tax=Weissella minor TaxID=1620 RepID=UPI001BAE6CD0|nr:phage antirepressor KilAC domain-containing protein [Weissella minor]MBS0950372.1 phage antirepressor KilAC domain-containing protein [Weissella minor]
MDNNLQIFDGLKVKEEKGQILFDAETVAIGVGIVESDGKYVRWQRVNKYLGKNSPQVEKIKKGDFITEQQLYKLAIKAESVQAEKCQDWVTEEVLPSIRKHGAYLTDTKIEEVLTSPDTIINLAQQLKKEQEEKLVLTQQVAESRPKADYYDKIMKSKSLVTISQIAGDYGWSARRMNTVLHELGVQYKVGGQWLLYAKHKDHGYTFSDTANITGKDGKDKVVMNTKWTQKGRVFIYNLLKANDIVPTIERELDMEA